VAVRDAPPDAGGRGADPGGAQCAREPRDACPGGRDRAGGLGASGGVAPRCRRCFESGSGGAARAGALGRAAGAARGGRHGRLAAGHARPGGARSARRAARRVEHRERAAAAARNDGRLGIPRALGAPPRRVLLRPAPAGAVCVGAPLEPDRADEGLRRARELRSRGTRPPRLVGAGPHAAVRPVRPRVDGARARPRARSLGTAEVRRARAARVVPAAVRFLGGGGGSRVAVDVPPRFRVDQSGAGTRLINPKSGWYIHCHTRATATTEEAYGSRNNARSTGAPDLRRPQTASARPSASAIDTGTYRAYSSVRPSAHQTRGSRTT